MKRNFHRIMMVGVSVSLVSLLLAAVPADAQSTMKTSDGSGGGKKEFTPGWKLRPDCLPTRSAGDTGPVARAVWKVTKPGVISYCVQGGAQGNYAPVPAIGGGSNSSGQTGQQLRIATSSAASPQTISVTLIDRRWAIDFERDWDPAQPDETMTYARMNPPRKHVSQTFAGSTLVEPVQPATVSMLPNAWCVQNLKWGSRPHLVVELSGPGVRGHTAEHETSCRVDFGPAEPASANLEQMLGVPAFPSSRSTPNTAATPLPAATLSKKQ